MTIKWIAPQLMLLWSWTSPAYAELSVTLNASARQISVGETFELEMSVSATGGGIDRVELPKLSDFEIISRREYRPIEFQFGLGSKTVYRSSINYTLTLRAMKVGRFDIGPVMAMSGKHKKESNRISIQVIASRSGHTSPDPQRGSQSLNRLQDPFDPQGESLTQQKDNNETNGIEAMQFDEQAFVSMSADNKSPFVGEQVTLTLKLYTRLPLRASPILIKEPSTEGFWLHNLLPPSGGPDPTRQIVKGVPFYVYVLRHMAAFPLRSGPLQVGAPHINLEVGSRLDVFGAFLGGGSLERQGIPMALEIKSLPPTDNSIPGQPVAVGRFEMTATRDRDHLTTGDALTFTVQIQGYGNLRGIELPSPVIPGVRVLAPETRDTQDIRDDKVYGIRSVSWLLIPEEPGHHQIPELSFMAFDPKEKQYIKVKSSQLSFVASGQSVTPNMPTSSRSADTQIKTSNDTWPPVRTHTQLTRNIKSPTSFLFWSYCLGAAALMWLASGFLPRKIHQSSKIKSTHTFQSVARSIEKGVHKVDESKAVLGELIQNLYDALDSNLEKTTRSLTRIELKQTMANNNLPFGTIDAILSWLDRYEAMRFSPSPPDVQDIKLAAVELQQLLKRIESKS